MNPIDRTSPHAAIQRNAPRRCSITQLLFCLALAVLTGCRTPDLVPFRDSTAKIHDSVVGAQDAYLAELQRLAALVPESSELAVQSRRFSTNWTARVAVMEAMVRYAGSLASVAGAPDAGKAGLEGVAKSVKELGVVAGPYGPAIEGATELLIEFKFLADKVAAAKQLKKAVLATDENMQRLAQLLTLDFARLRRSLEENQKSLKNLMDGPISRQLDTRQAVANRLAEKTRDLQRLMGTILEEADREKTADRTRSAEADAKADLNWNAAVRDFNKNMEDARSYLAEADKWYVPHQAKVEQARRELADRIRLLRDTEAALTQWGKAHAALTQSLQDGLSPDWTLLRQSADRVENSIRKINNEDSKP